MDIIKWNPFAPAFNKAIPKKQFVEEEQIVNNSQGLSREQIEELLYTGMYDNTSYNNVDFSLLFANKKQRVSFYRCMSMFPEINDALDWVSDDAIVPDDDGIVARLTIKKLDQIPKNIREKIYGIFQYLRDDVFRFNNNGWKMFNDWLIDSEYYSEVIMNSKKTNIIGVKKLPPFTIVPMYENGIIKGFHQSVDTDVSYMSYRNNKDLQITFASNQIAYANYGKYGTSMFDVRGYLEPAIRPYNQYKALQDSLIIHRLVNAPEKKVWNVDVGRMPKGKAEEYMRGLIQRYKRKDVYDPETGKVDSTQNMRAMNESYWFARQEDGKGTTVETIGGNMDIGNIEDFKAFQKILFQTLKLPKSRWEETTSYSSGKIGEIEREEVKFSNFIKRLRNSFKPILIDPFVTLLKLRGIDEKYLDKDLYDIEFTESNLFADFKEIDILESRFGLLSTASPYIATPENKDAGEAIFSKEFVVKNYFKLSDEDFIENQKLLEKELKEIESQQTGQEPDMSNTDNTELNQDNIDSQSNIDSEGSVNNTNNTEKKDDSNLSPLAKAKQASDDIQESKKYIINENLKRFINNYKV